MWIDDADDGEALHVCFRTWPSFITPCSHSRSNSRKVIGEYRNLNPLKSNRIFTQRYFAPVLLLSLEQQSYKFGPIRWNGRKMKKKCLLKWWHDTSERDPFFTSTTTFHPIRSSYASLFPQKYIYLVCFR